MNTKNSQKSSKKSQKMFHTPQTYGELVKIPMTTPMHIISISSILVQIVLTVFAVYAFMVQDSIAALSGSGFSSSIIYLVFPIVTWILSFGFRFCCSAIPFDMWRLPMSVRAGVKKSNGSLLKLMTLLAELETAICLLYISIARYLGSEPSNIVLIIWIVILVISIYLPGKKAASLAR